MQALDLQHALPDNLIVKVDRMLMAHGVEGRMPLVDRRVVSWGLGTADAQECDRLEGKKILKDWARGFTPTVHFSSQRRNAAFTKRSMIGGEETDSRSCRAY